jgi:hypothetical protein
VGITRWTVAGLAAVCPLVLMGCTRETSSRLAVYGLAESYVTRPDSARGFILELHEDGTFLLSGAVHGDPGDVSQLGEVARGAWTATATGVALSAEHWEAAFVVGETPMASWRTADTLATLEWSGGTGSSPVDSASFVSWPAYSELFHPRGGSGRRQSSW